MTIGSIAASSATGAAGNTLGLQDFLKILLTQLTYQDPLKPMDNQQFMAQMAQFSTLEQTQRLNDQLQQLTDNQAALQSVGLIGRTVDVKTASGTTSGVVASLSLQGSVPSLTLTLPNGSSLAQVSLADVLAIH